MSEFDSSSDGPEQRRRATQREKAAQFFKERETHKSMAFEEMQTDRVISDAKTARLRALRLAKEETARGFASGGSTAK